MKMMMAVVLMMASTVCMADPNIMVSGNEEPFGNPPVDLCLIEYKPIENIQVFDTNGACMLTLSWSNAVLDINIPDEQNTTKAAETFFVWMEQYFNTKYVLVERKELLRYLERLQEWENAANEYRRIVAEQSRE